MTVQGMIAESARRYGVPAEIAIAVAQRETNFNQEAIGAAGEVGLFQLMPGTAGDLGVNPHDIYQNIDGGVRYLREQYDRFGNWQQALQAYNAGPGNVMRGTVPEMTFDYMADVLRKAANWLGFGDDQPRAVVAPSRTSPSGFVPLVVDVPVGFPTPAIGAGALVLAVAGGVLLVSLLRPSKRGR